MYSTIIVPLCFRTIMFTMFYGFFWMFDGIANWNSALVMLFLALVIPLPPFQPFTIACERTFSFTMTILRLTYAVLVSLHDNILLPVEYVMRKYVLVWIVRSIILVARVNGFSLKILVTLIMFLIPQSLRISLSETLQVFAVFPAVLVRFLGLAMAVLLPQLDRLLSTLWLACQTFSENPILFLRGASSVLIYLTGLVIALPGPVSAINYTLTGYAYPGSLIRFHHCDKFKNEHKPLQHYFLQLSYCVWNSIRSFLFYKYSSNTDHWSMDVDLPKLLHAAVNGWLVTHIRLLAIGTFFPLFVDFQCASQATHNVICTLSNLAFLFILNGHRKFSMLMVYFTCSVVLLHFQSLIVSVFAALHSLQCSMNDLTVTCLFILELYFMFYVTVDTCKKAFWKVRNAGEDVLDIWPANDTIARNGQVVTTEDGTDDNEHHSEATTMSNEMTDLHRRVITNATD